MQIDINKISRLIKIVSESDIAELELKEGEEQIKITRTSNTVSVPVPVAQPAAYVAPAAVPAPVAAPAAAEADDSADTISGHVMKSPMVGTFYRSAGPGKDAFVNVGDSISNGKVLCIVEAMKLFNEIESEVSGKIVKILVDDASPVEYDQPLFLVDPS